MATVALENLGLSHIVSGRALCGTLMVVVMVFIRRFLA